VENKLSNYLESTIRTNSRQKYNYLSSQFNQKYDTLSKNYQVPYEPLLLRDRKNTQNPPNCTEKSRNQLNTGLKEREGGFLKENSIKPQEKIVQYPK
jgi:hypothetical protein